MPTEILAKSIKVAKVLGTRQLNLQCDRIPFECTNVPMKRMLNWLRVEASVLAKPTRPWGWPTHLKIEPSSICNLACELCPSAERLGRPRSLMQFDLFKKIIDEAGDYVLLLLLWGWGEPFLNPSIYDMIAYARSRDIKVVSSTNGHYLIQGDTADAVIRSGLDALIVAVDGTTQETYEHYRKGGNLETVLQGIKKLALRKQSLRSETPLINFRFLAMRHNEHEITKLKDLAQSCGADALSIKTLNPHPGNTYQLEITSSHEGDMELIPKDNRHRRFQYSPDGRSRLRVEKNPCKNLWNSMLIHWDGRVTSCSVDHQSRILLGNLQADSLKRVWWGKSYNDRRRRFRSDWEGLDLCCNCTYAYKGGDCFCEIISEFVLLKEHTHT